MDYARALFAGVLLSSLLAHASPTLAVNTVTPQIGTWAIDEEVDGKPGRGFQIDVQNNVLVLYFYGYESGGEATFWLAAGRIPDGSDELTAELGAYEGGMAFGDPLKNASYVGSRGNVTIRFASKTRGEICLPTEACKAISAFNFGFENSSSELLGDWVVIGNPESSAGLFEAWEFYFETLVPPSYPGVIDSVAGKTTLNVNGSPFRVEIVCDKYVTKAEWEYFCKTPRGPEQKRFYLNVERDGFRGAYQDPATGQIRGLVLGFRVSDLAGRVVLPN